MPPHLKASSAGSPVRTGRPRPPQNHSTGHLHHHQSTNNGGNPNPRSPSSRHVLPPRAEPKSGHRHHPPPRPIKSQSLRSHQQPLSSPTSDRPSNKNKNSQRDAAVVAAADDHASMTSSANMSTAANSTPSSVYMPSVPLSRDNMSDLSGLSGGTRASSVPGQIFDPKTFQQPWRQAYCLSSQPPPLTATTTAQPHNSNKKLQGGNVKDTDDNDNNDQSPSIWVAQNDVVEIFDNWQTALGFDRITKPPQQQQQQPHNRTPILILLMDPNRHCYELMQLWVDRGLDSIRDVMQALQRNLSHQHQSHQHQEIQSQQTKLPSTSSWKQAYDGIFQVRGHRFTQLINIIRLVKYDVQPQEILVAKPWAMTAKVTIAFANTIIRHLKGIGIISPHGIATGGLSGIKPPGPMEDAPLLLSRKAQERAYFPCGILDHHHAVQFVSFSPPFEKAVHLSRLSSSRSQDDGLSSLGSLSEDRQDVINIIASLGIPLPEENPSSPKSVIEKGIYGGDPTSNRNVVIQSGEKYDETEWSSNREEESARPVSASTKPRVRGFFSKLNCCRQNNVDKPKMSSPLLENVDAGSLSTMTPQTRAAVKLHQFREASLTALSEEEELQWLAYSIQPIAEDQSLAGGSTISMSAPLLKGAVANRMGPKSGGTPSKSAGSFPQPRTHSGRDVYEF